MVSFTRCDQCCEQEKINKKEKQTKVTFQEPAAFLIYYEDKANNVCNFKCLTLLHQRFMLLHNNVLTYCSDFKTFEQSNINLESGEPKCIQC